MSYDTGKNDRSASVNKELSSVPASGFGDVFAAKSQALVKLAKNPADINALQTLAAYHMHQNDFEAARKTYEELIELQPKNPEGYLNLSVALKKLGK